MSDDVNDIVDELKSVAHAHKIHTFVYTNDGDSREVVVYENVLVYPMTNVSVAIYEIDSGRCFEINFTYIMKIEYGGGSIKFILDQMLREVRRATRSPDSGDMIK